MRPPTRIVLLLGLLGLSTAQAQGTGVLTGTVLDAATFAPVPAVTVTATSPALQGEQRVETDSSGTYRLPNLPAGTYAVRLSKEGYQALERAAIELQTDAAVRVNAEILPENLVAQEVLVVGAAPAIDLAASWTGVRVGSDVADRLPLIRPGGKDAAVRSFESVAEVAPGARLDRFGVSLSGATSPENQFFVDGLSVNNPGFGILGTPLTLDFVREVHVVTGGYLPEFGRATGGVLNVVTRSGSNELRGSVFGSLSPGAFEGRLRTVESEVGGIRHDLRLWNEGSFGAELGGPILRDRLWFYAGFAPGTTRREVDQVVSARRPCTAEQIRTGENRCTEDQLVQRDEATGFPLVDRVSSIRRFADQESFHYIGKLTWRVAEDHHLTLSAYGAPSRSGGEGEFGINPQSGQVEVMPSLGGELGALAHRYDAGANDLSAKYSGAFLDKRILVDVTAGWHHQTASRLPSDGSELGSTSGLAGVPGTFYLVERQAPDVVSGVDPARCTGTATLPDGGEVVLPLCPVSPSWGGGPEFLYSSTLDRYQAKAVGTLFLNALGHHLIKAGVDAEQMVYDNTKAFAGRAILVGLEDPDLGPLYFVYRMFGALDGPDQVTISAQHRALSSSSTIGGFVQDSWSILDVITVNLGVRYDHQTLFGNDRSVAMSLGNQWSPRIGVVYDFTRQGRSRVYGNFARYYENVPLDVIDRQFSGERLLQALIAGRPDALGNGGPGCDPSVAENQCFDERNLIGDPGARWSALGGESTPVDPEIEPQSTDEWVAGAEYEVLQNGRLGASYTRRSIHRAIEDMSLDDGATYFIGNPGYGMGAAFPRAVRDYDAVSVYFDKRFADEWFAHASYTWSHLRGNYVGLFRPETGQLDPNMNTLFDLPVLVTNSSGPLPGDHTHAIKAFAAKDFALTDAMRVSVGAGYRARSGEAINALGAHANYGPDEIFIEPRGSRGRLPWQHAFDLQLGFSYRLAGSTRLTVSASAFNLLNIQGVTSVDERFTADVVDEPIDPTTGRRAEDLAVTRNPNFRNPDAYQPPRMIRLAARVSF